MSYNWNEDFIQLKADKTKDIIETKEAGGVSQLIYHPFRYKNYELCILSNDYYAYPVCKLGKEPTFPKDESLSGKGLLVSLCNLAKHIDNFDNNIPYDRLIVDWCKENMHPYSVNFIYSELIKEDFAEKEGVFRICDFMTDLGKLYNAALLYETLESVYVADEDAIYNLYKGGKHFEGLPFFKHHKSSRDKPYINVKSAKSDFPKEMQLNSNYERIRKKLIDCIPDFNIRLKVNSQTNRLEFSADINSVFDIAWFTLARMLSESPSPEDEKQSDERPEGIMICCKYCGDFLIRRNNRQEYCDTQECQKARNAKNQREFRRRKRIENDQTQ